MHSTCVSQPRINQQILLDISGRSGTDWIPDIAGALDGTHIEISIQHDHPASWITSKEYSSIDVFAVADVNSRLVSVVSGAPEICHDAAVFRKSVLAAHILDGWTLSSKMLEMTKLFIVVDYTN